jgi:hypothetical protein
LPEGKMSNQLPTARQLSKFQKEIESLLKALKPEIGDEYRAHEESTLPSMLVTVGAELQDGEIVWNYQTGDNSYTGGAYGFANWGTADLYRRSNTKELAADIIDNLFSY